MSVRQSQVGVPLKLLLYTSNINYYILCIMKKTFFSRSQPNRQSQNVWHLTYSSLFFAVYSHPVPAPRIRFTIFALYKFVCMYVAKVFVATASEGCSVIRNKKHLKNVGPIRHCEPPHAACFTLPFTGCRYCRTPPLSHAACASMSTTSSTTTTTTRDRKDRYGPSNDFMSGIIVDLSLIHIWRCRRSYACRSRWSPYH